MPGGPLADADRRPLTIEDRALFIYTSGTTGLPKFCAQTHEYFLRLGSAMAEALDLQAGDRMLAPLPLFHINPMGYGIIGALCAGADALTVRKFSASGFWPAVREHGVTALALHAPPVEILKRATTTADLVALYRDFYAGEPFVRVADEGIRPTTRGVVGSNFCDVAVVADPRTGRAICVSAIDNLGKGGSANGVQNLNAMMGWDERTGLDASPVYP